MTVAELRKVLETVSAGLPVVYSDSERGDVVVKRIEVRGLDAKGDIPVVVLSDTVLGQP